MKNNRTATLTLGALGIVYGDIGTSPLYALRECFSPAHGITLEAASIFGVLSLILWSLIWVVTLKYLSFVMRADNRGEGGILALMALTDDRSERGLSGKLSWVIGLGLGGAALLYGDAIITPAISVLSAVEGLEIVTPYFKSYVIALTVIIIAGVFLVQSRGTDRIGRYFGPIMLVWFLALAVLGIRGIRLAPGILAAFNPLYAVRLLVTHAWQGFVVLGSVFLAVTGGEALYADMGHFGRRPIQIGWYFVALPSLVIHYFGQGALLLSDPTAIENPFYHLAPGWALFPLVMLATVATVIASQAMLTGAFALSHQAIQLGYLPWMQTVHTSAEARHQIYVPVINWMLFVGTVSLVLAFGSSSKLAAAYGIAVTGTMVITTLLTYGVARDQWKWPPALALGVTTFFLIPDLAFLGANSLKIRHGGWLPLLFGGVIFFTMATWKRGRALVGDRKRERSLKPHRFIQEVTASITTRVPGNAVFMTEFKGTVPSALVQNVRHNHVLHENIILLTIETADVPFVAAENRVELEDLGHHFYHVTARYGFMDSPHVPEFLEQCALKYAAGSSGALARWLNAPLDSTIYFFSHDNVVATDVPGMALWRERFFAFLARNSKRSSTYFQVPSAQVIQIGETVDL